MGVLTGLSASTVDINWSASYISVSIRANIFDGHNWVIAL